MEPEISIKQERSEQIDHAILKAFDNDPSLSTYEISDTTGYPQSTAYYHLTHNLHYKFRVLPKLPHDLDEDKKEQRVIKSNELLKILENAKKKNINIYIRVMNPVFL